MPRRKKPLHIVDGHLMFARHAKRIVFSVIRNGVAIHVVSDERKGPVGPWTAYSGYIQKIDELTGLGHKIQGASFGQSSIEKAVDAAAKKVKGYKVPLE